MRKTFSWMDHLRCHHAHMRYQQQLRRRDNMHNVHGDSIGEAAHPGPVVEASVRACLVAEDVVLLGDMGLREFERPVHARELFPLSNRGS